MMTVKEKSKKCRELNAIPILFFEDYLISRDGKLYYLDPETGIHTDISHIILKYTKKGVPVYRILDLKNKEIYLELPLDKLILNTFVGDLEGKILHKDSDYTNCTLDNLYYELIITKVDNSDSLWINNKEFKLIDVESDNKYYINEEGIVYNSYTNKFGKKLFSEELYVKIKIIKARSIHRLVYEAWINTIPESFTINHIDGNKFNNHYSNLELMSFSENVRHAHNNGLRKDSKLAENQVYNLCYMIENGIKFKDICKYFDVYTKKDIKNLSGTIADIRRGKIWKDISCKFDLDTSYIGKLRPDKVHKICCMLDAGYSIEDIEISTHVIPGIIKNIQKGLYYTKISSSYNFIKNNYKFKEN